MNIKLSVGNSFAKKLQKRINGFEFQVGILEDGPHYNPVETKSIYDTPDLKTYAGGPARKQTRTAGPLTIGEIFIKNMERLNINLLQRSFQERNSDIIKFTNEFLKLAVKRTDISVKRLENLLQAIVRNPILKQEYGQNSSIAADNKGFDRHLIDTAQMFKAITARMTKRGR